MKRHAFLIGMLLGLLSFTSTRSKAEDDQSVDERTSQTVTATLTDLEIAKHGIYARFTTNGTWGDSGTKYDFRYFVSNKAVNYQLVLEILRYSWGKSYIVVGDAPISVISKDKQLYAVGINNLFSQQMNNAVGVVKAFEVTKAGNLIYLLGGDESEQIYRFDKKSSLPFLKKLLRSHSDRTQLEE